MDIVPDFAVQYRTSNIAERLPAAMSRVCLPSGLPPLQDEDLPRALERVVACRAPDLTAVVVHPARVWPRGIGIAHGVHGGRSSHWKRVRLPCHAMPCHALRLRSRTGGVGLVLRQEVQNRGVAQQTALEQERSQGLQGPRNSPEIDCF